MIKETKVGKLLGVLIDNKLTWGPHIESVNTKVLLSLGGISCLAELTLGENLLTIRRIFQAAIILRISYSSSVWYTQYGYGETSHKKSHFKKLEVLQSKAAQIIISSFRATSIPALSIKAYFILMHYMLDKLVIESALQIAETLFYNLL